MRGSLMPEGRQREALGQCGDLYAAGRLHPLCRAQRRDGAAVQQELPHRNAQAGKVHIFLGIYRAGLAELQAYTVSVSVGSTPLDGTVLLPGRAYTLPSSVSCPDGKRDATFFLTVDIAYLKANADKDFSLPVTISDPTRYALNDKLTTTQVRIDTSELLSKEGL